MQQDYAESLLRSGIIEAKAGAWEPARRYLERAIYASDNNQHDTMAEAWFWMAEVTADPVEKRKALENALVHDMGHSRARRALGIVDGRIKPGELIDPDRLPTISVARAQGQAERFMCPKCGGCMSFAPDGQSLVCDFCARHAPLEAHPLDAAAEEDFLLAMHTLRGHRNSVAQKVFHCSGCGAEFILAPTLISASCPYCGSPHVASRERSADLIAIDALLPHAFDQQQASTYIVRWIGENKIKSVTLAEKPRGLYLPAWIFVLGGEIDYTGQALAQENPHEEQVLQLAPVHESLPVQMRDVIVPATRKHARLLSGLLSSFGLGELQGYDPGYLAGWPAEVYDVSVGDASLDARSQAYRHYGRRLQLDALPRNIRITSTSSARLSVESFRLVLLPVWLAHIMRDGHQEPLLVNGQNGFVTGSMLEKKSPLDWLGDILGI